MAETLDREKNFRFTANVSNSRAETQAISPRVEELLSVLKATRLIDGA
jgi:hypothetical protein